MLNMLKRNLDANLVPTSDPPAAPSQPTERGSLQIGNLLDDPDLRRAMGLEVYAQPAPPPEELSAPLPPPRFDRRRLLEPAA